MSKSKKITRGVLFALLAALILYSLTMLCLFIPTFRTMSTVKKLSDYPYYKMTYSADYNMDKLLSQGGASTDDELVSFVIKNALHGLPVHIDYEIPDTGCSAFKAVGAEGTVLMGRNLDADKTPVLTLFSAPKDGFKSVSCVDLAFLGYTSDYLPDSFVDRFTALAAPYFPLDGMNEKGVCAAVLDIYSAAVQQDTDKTDITTTMAIRLILDHASSVEDALDILSEYDMHASANCNYQFLIADSTGRSVIVAYDGNKEIVTEGKGNYQLCTNFYVCDVSCEHEDVGMRRYDSADNLLRKYDGTLTKSLAMDVLSAAQSDDKTPDEGFGPEDITPTQWSEVFDLTGRSVTIAVGRDYADTYTFGVTDTVD